MYFHSIFKNCLAKENALLDADFFHQWPFISLPILGHNVTNHTVDFQIVSHISLGNYHLL